MSQYKFVTRRRLVQLSIQLPIVSAAAGLLAACGNGKAAQCANPDDWSLSEKGLRNANNYTELSADADKNCANCAFFKTADASSSCGQCEIFVGLAHKDGHCDSWSAKV